MVLKSFVIICLGVGFLSKTSQADSASVFTRWADNLWSVCSQSEQDSIRKNCIHKLVKRKAEESHAVLAVDQMCSDLDSYWEKCYTAGMTFLKKDPPPWSDSESVYKLTNLVSDTCGGIIPSEDPNYKIGNTEQAGYDEDKFQCFANAAKLSPSIKKAYADNKCSSGLFSNLSTSQKVSQCHQEALKIFIATMDKQREGAVATLRPPKERPAR